MIGRTVYVTYAKMEGTITGVEYPYSDDKSTPLWTIELEDGRECYATSSQIR